jgi:hypothetical protein
MLFPLLLSDSLRHGVFSRCTTPLRSLGEIGSQVFRLGMYGHMTDMKISIICVISTLEDTFLPLPSYLFTVKVVVLLSE